MDRGDCSALEYRCGAGPHRASEVLFATAKEVNVETWGGRRAASAVRSTRTRIVHGIGLMAAVVPQDLVHIGRSRRDYM